ncbi:MAG: hypothetical protein ACJ749_12975 [Flavisolibacter sp.]
MGYIVIELPVAAKEGYFFADFDKKKFEEEKGITLIGEPIKAERTSEKLTLVFEGHLTKRRPPMGFSVSR